MTQIVSSTQLRTFVNHIFIAMGCSVEDARIATEVLVSADLRGIDSHGVARLAGYIRLMDNQRLNTTPQVRILHETPSTATMDADKGLGLVIASKAMKVAMEKAEKVGTGWVAVQNSNHFGIAGFHASLALEKDMIGWAMTHAAPLVTPTFSKERLLGTNPLAIAIPALKKAPFLADFATTAVAYGKLEILQRKNQSIPEGWAQDEEGNPTHDAHAIKNGGGLLPLGTDRIHGSHKGYALGAVVDILSGVLSGANFGPWVPPFATAGFMSASESVGKGTGHFFGAMRIDAFRPAIDFKKDMDRWIERFEKAKSIGNQKVMIPGEPERITEKERLEKGIPLQNAVREELRKIAERFQVPIFE